MNLQAFETLEGDVLSGEERSHELKNFSWAWKENSSTHNEWSTSGSPTSPHEDVSTVDSSEILYNFGYLDHSDNNKTPPLYNNNNNSFRETSTKTFSASSPSNFSSTSSEVDDIEMRSLIEFCSLNNTDNDSLSTDKVVTSSVAVTCINVELSKPSKKKVGSKRSSSKRFRCCQCDKTFFSLHYLRFHESSVHHQVPISPIFPYGN